jgi:hypothetical protein
MSYMLYKVININDLFALCAAKKCFQSEVEAKIYIEGLIDAFTTAEYRIGQTPTFSNLQANVAQYLEVWPIGNGVYRTKYFLMSHDTCSHIIVTRTIAEGEEFDLDCSFTIAPQKGTLTDIGNDFIKQGYQQKSEFNNIRLFERACENGCIQQIFII